MFKVNAFTLWLNKTAGKGKLAPLYTRISRQGEGSGVAKIILESRGTYACLKPGYHYAKQWNLLVPEHSTFTWSTLLVGARIVVPSLKQICRKRQRTKGCVSGTKTAPRQGVLTGNVSIVPAHNKAYRVQNGSKPSGLRMRRVIPPSLFRRPAALPLPGFYEMMVGQVYFFQSEQF
jgi:hypothetical protein